MGLSELLLIGLIIMLILGGNRLPDLGRGLGRAIRGFRDAIREDKKP